MNNELSISFNPSLILITLMLFLFGIETALGQKYTKVELKNGHTAFSNASATLIIDLKEHGSRAELLFFNDNCIVLGRGKKIDWLVASTDFDPNTIPRSIRRGFQKTQVITLMKMKGNSNMRDTLKFLPSWVFTLSNLKALELNNFIVDGGVPIDQLMISYLVIKDCQIQDVANFITKASKNLNLGFLIHREILSSDDIDKIAAQTTRIKVIPDADATIGIEQNGVEYMIRMPN